MSNAAKVALVLLPLVVVALAAALWLGEASAPARVARPACVTGDAAGNPAVVDPRDPSKTITMPTNRQVRTVMEAEAFICLHVPTPILPDGWEVMVVTAHRSQSLEKFFDHPGLGYRALDIQYLSSTRRIGFNLYISPGSCGTIDAFSDPVDYPINGVTGQLRQRSASDPAPAFMIDWVKGGYCFMAMGGGQTEIDDILPVLQSIAIRR